jgi:hypothetical protein
MFSQKFFFTIDNFPYQVVYDSWSNAHLATGHGRYARITNSEVLDRFLEEHMLQHDRAQVVSPSSDVAKI